MYVNEVVERPNGASWLEPRLVRHESSARVGVDDLSFVGDPGHTDQSAKKECDINEIVRKFTATGVLPGFDREALYGDFSSVPDFQRALEIVAQAEDQFAALDPYLRRRFNDDPAEFLAFCSDAQNAPEMESLGLLNPKAAEAPNDAPSSPNAKVSGASKGGPKPKATAASPSQPAPAAPSEEG